MHPQHLTVVVAIAALLGSVALFTFTDTVVVEPGRPSSTASAPQLLVAAVPHIGDFDREFHVNYENPFVPYNERVADRDNSDPRTRAQKMPPRITPTPPPEKPPVKVEPAKLVLPARRDPAPGAPECLGVLRHGPSGQAVVLVRLPNQAPQPLAVGEAIGGWTLQEIGAGVARFQRPDGTEETLPVGTATDGAATVIPPSAPAPPANPPAARPSGPTPMIPMPAGEPRMRPQP